MAQLDSILEQINKSDLDILALLKLRSTVEDKLTARHRDLRKQLAAVEDAMGVGAEASAAVAGSAGGQVRRGRRPGRPARSAASAGKPARKSRRGGARSARTSGKHGEMSVGEAVVALLKAKGGKMSAAEIKQHFAAAGDRRNLNFTLLSRAGLVKRIGFEKKEEGKKGRAGGIYALA
jgi:hypothetical protein